MPTQLTVKNLPTGFQTIISNGRHSILADEPVKSKGTDLGFSPPELVLAGLAMCKAATVRFIARREGWADRLRDVDVVATQKVRRNRETGQLRTQADFTIQIEGDLTDAERATLVREADACYIHRMLEGDWELGAITERPITTAETAE